MADNPKVFDNRAVMTHPKDYRKPNGEFDVAICLECDGNCFYTEKAAMDHAQTGHKMEMTRKIILSMRAT